MDIVVIVVLVNHQGLCHVRHYNLFEAKVNPNPA